MSKDDKAMLAVLEELENAWELIAFEIDESSFLSFHLDSKYKNIVENYPETKPLLVRLGKIKDE